MMRVALLLCPLLLVAQTEVPVGVVSGYISDIKNSSFLLTTIAKKEFRCTYDNRTWFEQSRVRVTATAFQPTDLVELVADRRFIDGKPCYIRTVRLADMAPKESGRMRITYRAVTENLIPRGEYAWAGIVSQIDPSRIILRKRGEGHKTMLLRRDTRYFEDGVISEHQRLKPNTQIFVRAGRNLEGDLEIYQVIWGAVTP